MQINHQGYKTLLHKSQLVFPQYLFYTVKKHVWMIKITHLSMNDLRMTFVKSYPWHSTVHCSMFCPAMLHWEAPLGIVSNGKSSIYFTHWVYCLYTLFIYSCFRMSWITGDGVKHVIQPHSYVDGNKMMGFRMTMVLCLWYQPWYQPCCSHRRKHHTKKKKKFEQWFRNNCDIHSSIETKVVKA